jgi:hypothetical protein
MSCHLEPAGDVKIGLPQLMIYCCSASIHDDPLIILSSVLLTLITLGVLKLKAMLVCSNSPRNYHAKVVQKICPD